MTRRRRQRQRRRQGRRSNPEEQPAAHSETRRTSACYRERVLILLAKNKDRLTCGGTRGVRTPRKCVDGATYHVVARANRREFILEDTRVKRLFLKTLAEAKEKYRFQVINLCIMSNHVHLMIATEPDHSISRIMQWILGVFALRFNRAHSLQGHVWYDRFKSRIVGSLRQYLATFRYILENPVRARLVERPEEYAFNGCVLIREGPTGGVDPPGSLLRVLFPGFGQQQLPCLGH